ncbi:hypothetical protein K3495_g16939, partial [Podosphaera aphanis]
IYYKDSMKYGGQKDSLDFMLDEFHEMCSAAGVSEDCKSIAFPIMLKDSAKIYYSENIRGKISKFDVMVEAVRHNFETPELQREMQSSFNTITLAKIIDQNKTTKTKFECLEELVTEIQRLYRGLPKYNRLSQNSDAQLRDKLLSACEEDADCAMACMNPATTFQAFISQLRTSINLASKIRQPRRPAQHFADESGDNEIFYTDR